MLIRSLACPLPPAGAPEVHHWARQSPCQAQRSQTSSDLTRPRPSAAGARSPTLSREPCCWIGAISRPLCVHPHTFQLFDATLLTLLRSVLRRSPCMSPLPPGSPLPPSCPPTSGNACSGARSSNRSNAACVCKALPKLPRVCGAGLAHLFNVLQRRMPCAANDDTSVPAAAGLLNAHGRQACSFAEAQGVHGAVVEGNWKRIECMIVVDLHLLRY